MSIQNSFWDRYLSVAPHTQVPVPKTITRLSFTREPKSQSKLDDDSYEVGDGKPMQEVELPDEAFASNAVKSSETNDTDWDVTETE